MNQNKIYFLTLILFFPLFSNEYTHDDIRCELENCLADGYPLLQCKSDLADMTLLYQRCKSFLESYKTTQKSSQVDLKDQIGKLESENKELKKELDRLNNGLEIWEKEYREIYKLIAENSDIIDFDIKLIKDSIERGDSSFPSVYNLSGSDLDKAADEAVEYFERLADRKDF